MRDQVDLIVLTGFGEMDGRMSPIQVMKRLLPYCSSGSKGSQIAKGQEANPLLCTNVTVPPQQSIGIPMFAEALGRREAPTEGQGPMDRSGLRVLGAIRSN